MVTTPKVRPERVSVFHESCKRTESQGNRTFPEGDSAELTERKADRFVDSRVYMGFPLVTILHQSIDRRYVCRKRRKRQLILLNVVLILYLVHLH